MQNRFNQSVWGVAMVAVVMANNVLADEPGWFVRELKGYSDTPFYPGAKYRVHDPSEPKPPRVIPPASDGSMGTPPPADAIVLFDGTSLDQFNKTEWQLQDGVIIAGKGGLQTKQKFGSFQLHIEWRPPAELAEKLGHMGNSGIFLMNKYELQVFDSYSCKIYADGSAGAIYGQTPPLVNVCRKPGEWQTYDVIFTAPVFDGDKVVSLPRITALHNGVLIQNDTEILGPTRHKNTFPMEVHADRMPFYLQGHGSPVEYRNIWLREID